MGSRRWRELDWRHPIDDVSIESKFLKKTKTLTLSGWN